jgi:predicted metal-dependent enzyme (double-stranded beta helix superfamily)
MSKLKIVPIFPTPLDPTDERTSWESQSKHLSPQSRQAKARLPKQQEYEQDQRPFITKVDRLRWKIEFLSGINWKINRESPLYEKVFYYIRLAIQTELSGKENADFYMLCREAEQNPELESWIERVDDCITRLEQPAIQILPGFISLEEFLAEYRKIDPAEMNLSLFTDLVQRVDISEDLLNRYIPDASQKSFAKENIHTCRLLGISVMLWKPGGAIPAHEHQNSLSIIRVCKGTLSHCKNLPSNQTNTTIRREKIDYFEDELVTIDYGEHHELSNQQRDKDLVTIHFRFYRPSDDRDREGLYIPRE